MLLSALGLGVARAFNPFPKIDKLEAPLVATVGVSLLIPHLTKLPISGYLNFINELLLPCELNPEKGFVLPVIPEISPCGLSEPFAQVVGQ
ncbi:hypothetical protein XBJ1_3063 [Xenorhabdus bovienii SS-2004]|uniref:Uncharacterized protein n=1 Tax=Xenorhabdus bovienii (strain SS-2004) TaxID=406818 RepID=D3V8M5_XENBS|nr:hypothetical protein XBJ1_3063 [Xenorhabdus bovienii SS-2004]